MSYKTNKEPPKMFKSPRKLKLKKPYLSHSKASLVWGCLLPKYSILSNAVSVQPLDFDQLRPNLNLKATHIDYKTNMFLQFYDTKYENDLEKYLLSNNKYSIRALSSLILLVNLWGDSAFWAVILYLLAIFGTFANKLQPVIRQTLIVRLKILLT